MHTQDVVVPGGQAIYIDPSGALSFTVPHSGYEPAGSSTGPFKYTAGKPFGSWTYTGQGASGFMACPVPAPATTSSASLSLSPSATPSPTGTVSAVPYHRRRVVSSAPQWQVFANLRNATVPSGRVDDCLGFDALAVSVHKVQPAWEYI